MWEWGCDPRFLISTSRVVNCFIAPGLFRMAVSQKQMYNAWKSTPGPDDDESTSMSLVQRQPTAKLSGVVSRGEGTDAQLPVYCEQHKEHPRQVER